VWINGIQYLGWATEELMAWWQKIGVLQEDMSGPQQDILREQLQEDNDA
jgi:hypothetical protein